MASVSLPHELADVGGGDAVHLRGLGEGVAAADPQLALTVEPELAVLAVGARQQVDRRVVPGGRRLEDEDAVLRLVAGQVRVLGRGAEGVLGVVRAGLEVARGDDDALTGEAGGEGGAAGGRLGRLRDRLEAVQLRVGPAGLHALGELVGHARVQAVLALLDRLVALGLRDLRVLRGELLRHVFLLDTALGTAKGAAWVQRWTPSIVRSYGRGPRAGRPVTSGATGRTAPVTGITRSARRAARRPRRCRRRRARPAGRCAGRGRRSPRGRRGSCAGRRMAAACRRAKARSIGSPVRCSRPSVYSSTVSPGSGLNSTLGASQQASMPSGADSDVSTNSVRLSPITSGGLCPAPARTTLRRAGSQYAKRAVALRAGSVSRSSSSRSDRTATGSSPSITAYARRLALVGPSRRRRSPRSR